jgi:predicted cupin superfamily sugar epimerase
MWKSKNEMISSAKYWIEKLNLEKHPEGGWFKEIYRSEEVIPKEALPEYFSGSRILSTSIYYLLEGDDFSAFHRIKSDEIWHYYAGNSAIEILSIEKGNLKKQLLGNQPEKNQVLQFVVPKNTWFAAKLTSSKGFALVGCTVSPGFHFDDFEMAGKDLLTKFPILENEIRELIR